MSPFGILVAISAFLQQAGTKRGICLGNGRDKVITASTFTNIAYCVEVMDVRREVPILLRKSLTSQWSVSAELQAVLGHCRSRRCGSAANMALGGSKTSPDAARLAV